MTREEEIWNAINNLQIGVYDEDISSDNDDYNNDEYDGSDLQNAFYAGAKWADNNPKNPWISVEDDLPFNHKELLDSSKRMTFQVFIRYDDDRYGFSCMAKIIDEWKWLNNWNKITHWMKVPEIPKEE